MIRMSEQKDMSGDKTLSGGGFNQSVRRICMVSICQTSLYLFTVSHRHDKGRLFKQHRSRAGPF